MKTLLLFLFTILFSLQVFSQATSGTRITSPIVPNDSSDVYPTHDAYFGRDGYRSVLTISERNAIKTGLRKEGMQVYVKADSTIYQLRKGISNSNWFIVNNTLLPSITAFVNDNFANGGVVIVVIIDVDTFNFQGHNLSYNWRGPGGFSSTDKSNMTITPGLYNVIVTDNVTGKTYQSSVYVIQAIQWTGLGQPMYYFENFANQFVARSIPDISYVDSLINIAVPQYLYKTVYVDSAKFRNDFDTALIVNPGIGKIIIIDKGLITPISGTDYSDIACFMLYEGNYIIADADSFDCSGNNLGTFSKNWVNRILFFEFIPGNRPRFSYRNNVEILPCWSEPVNFIKQNDANWIYIALPSSLLAVVRQSNVSIRFRAGDASNAAGANCAHNTGNYKFKLIIKYHIETIQ
jgi:hypothetical protein